MHAKFTRKCSLVHGHDWKCKEEMNCFKCMVGACWKQVLVAVMVCELYCLHWQLYLLAVALVQLCWLLYATLVPDMGFIVPHKVFEVHQSCLACVGHNLTVCGIGSWTSDQREHWHSSKGQIHEDNQGKSLTFPYHEVKPMHSEDQVFTGHFGYMLAKCKNNIFKVLPLAVGCGFWFWPNIPLFICKIMSQFFMPHLVSLT